MECYDKLWGKDKGQMEDTFLLLPFSQMPHFGVACPKSNHVWVSTFLQLGHHSSCGVIHLPITHVTAASSCY